MKRLLIICTLLIVFVAGCAIFQDALPYGMGRSEVSEPPCNIKEIIDVFTKAYNDGQITDSTIYFTDDFQWLSDTEWVNGEQINHFSGQTHEELLTYFQNQYELGQRIHVTDIGNSNASTWHGAVDIGMYRGTSETSNGIGELTGKGVIDCQTGKIAVWSMGTHYPDFKTTSNAMN